MPLKVPALFWLRSTLITTEVFVIRIYSDCSEGSSSDAADPDLPISLDLQVMGKWGKANFIVL